MCSVEDDPLALRPRQRAQAIERAKEALLIYEQIESLR
jgi:hypothetical protein